MCRTAGVPPQICWRIEHAHTSSSCKQLCSLWCRFGDSGGSQQSTPRAWKAKFGGLGRNEGESEGQPLWWRAGRLPKKETGAQDEENQQNSEQKVNTRPAIFYNGQRLLS